MGNTSKGIVLEVCSKIVILPSPVLAQTLKRHGFIFILSNSPVSHPPSLDHQHQPGIVVKPNKSLVTPYSNTDPKVLGNRDVNWNGFRKSHLPGLIKECEVLVPKWDCSPAHILPMFIFWVEKHGNKISEFSYENLWPALYSKYLKL